MLLIDVGSYIGVLFCDALKKDDKLTFKFWDY